VTLKNIPLCHLQIYIEASNTGPGNGEVLHLHLMHLAVLLKCIETTGDHN